MLGEFAIWLSVASYHEDRTKNYNEVNPGIFFESPGFLSGYYYNSYKRHTLFGAVNMPLMHTKFGTLSAVAGLATGYDSPWIGGFRWKTDKVSIFFIPPMFGQPAFAGLAIKLGN